MTRRGPRPDRCVALLVHVLPLSDRRRSRRCRSAAGHQVDLAPSSDSSCGMSPPSRGPAATPPQMPPPMISTPKTSSAPTSTDRFSSGGRQEDGDHEHGRGEDDDEEHGADLGHRQQDPRHASTRMAITSTAPIGISSGCIRWSRIALFCTGSPVARSDQALTVHSTPAIGQADEQPMPNSTVPTARPTIGARGRGRRTMRPEAQALGGDDPQVDPGAGDLARSTVAPWSSASASGNRRGTPR